ncbi:hypothetical protein ACFLSQ_05225 [Bacteroidota bacterium]
MIEVSEDKVIFSRETWEELKSDDYFRELIEVIEEREALSKAKEETVSFIDLDEYHEKRMKKENV